MRTLLVFLLGAAAGVIAGYQLDREALVAYGRNGDIPIQGERVFG